MFLSAACKHLDMINDTSTIEYEVYCHTPVEVEIEDEVEVEDWGRLYYQKKPPPPLPPPHRGL